MQTRPTEQLYQEAEARPRPRIRKRWRRKALNIRMSRALPIFRWVPSATTLIGMTAALLLSVVSEAAVDARENKIEQTRDISNNASVADTPQSTEVATERQSWRKSEIVVVLDASLDLLPIAADVLIEAAFRTWQDTGASLPNIVFERGHGAKASLRPDGKNTIMVAPIEFDGHQTDLAITIGFSNPLNGAITEADIVINQRHLFKIITDLEVQGNTTQPLTTPSPMEQESCTGSLAPQACEDSYDLENVMTHEIGHFFGLGENYDDTRSTMFSCTSACEIHKRDLSSPDVNEIVALYDVPLDEPQAGCTGAQIGGHPRHNRGYHLGMWSLLGLALAARSWRSRRSCE